MSYIIIDVPEDNIFDGTQLSFKAPCDCTTPSGLKIGTKIFNLVDAMSNIITGSSGYFSSGALMTVTLDVTNLKAFVHNAVDPTANKNEADAYDATAIYSVGEYCINGNVLYECNTDISTPEAFTPAHWTRRTIGKLIETINNNLSALAIKDYDFAIASVSIPANDSRDYSIPSDVLQNKVILQWIPKSAMLGSLTYRVDTEGRRVVIKNTSSSAVTFSDTVFKIYFLDSIN